jgi:cathepsin F
MNTKMMILISAVLLFSLVNSQSEPNPEDYPNRMSFEQDKAMFSRFQNFITKFHKKYSTTEEMMERYQIFQNNYVELENMLKDTNQKHKSGVTQFMDLTPEEFNKQFQNLDVPALDQLKAMSQSPNSAPIRKLQSLPVNFDWRTKGAVGVVKNQGSCGSCWAFSTIANAEGQYKIKYGKLLNFSEQHLLDCSGAGTCNGGTIQSAMTYINNIKRLSINSQYPYKQVRQTCRHSAANSVAFNASGWVSASSTNEETIRAFLYNTGPLSIALNANQLQFYYGGIIQSCASNVLTHGVTLVGYGTSNGIPYWIIKNSWGPNWGEAGYFRIQRGKGLCGLNKYALSLKLR